MGLLKKQFMAQNEPSNEEQEDGAKDDSKKEDVKEVKEVRAEQAVDLKDDEKEAVDPNVNNNNNDNDEENGNDGDDVAPDEPVVVESSKKVESVNAVDEEDNKKSETEADKVMS